MAEESSPMPPKPPSPPTAKSGSREASAPKTPSLPRQMGPYTLLERIGSGGMGSVYRATHNAASPAVAIKVMSESTRVNPVLLRRFEQEFRAASRLDHPNMVKALDYGEVEGVPYLVMELVEGKNLAEYVEEKGRLPELEAIRLVSQVAQGLHRAHKLGLVHRDVKPENILISTEGQAKLTDLGLVKEAETDLNLTRTGRGLGTPHFMAPEQFKNAKLADSRCDIYSLGATLYAAVTGQIPFGGISPLEAWMKKVQDEYPTPRALVPEISERTDWAIRRAMASDPELRPATCREFVEDLTGRTTRKSFSAPENDKDSWYLRYLDDHGTEVAVKGSRAAVRRSLRDGLLGDASNVQASRSRQGAFLHLRDLPEFRDLIVVVPTPQTPTARPKEETIFSAKSVVDGNRSTASLNTIQFPPEGLHPQPSGATKEDTKFNLLRQLSRSTGHKALPYWVSFLVAALLLVGVAILYLLLR